MKRLALFLLVLATVGCGGENQSSNKRQESAVEIVQDSSGEVRIPVEELPPNFDSQSPSEQQQTLEQLIVSSGAPGSEGFSLQCAARKACAYYWINGRAYLHCWGGWGCKP
jgi:hypothetical protein